MLYITNSLRIYTFQEIRSEHPNISLSENPETLMNIGYYELIDNIPEFDSNYYKAIPINVEFINSKAFRIYEIQPIDIEILKLRIVEEVKNKVSQKLFTSNWRIERAKERELLGSAGEKVVDVLKEREAVRKAGNRVEALVLAATNLEAVKAITFEVTTVDVVKQERVSRVEFLNRFTDAEMQAFVTASKQSTALEAYLLKLQNAEGVVLTDPVTITGIQGLEYANIIAPGRSAEILSLV